MQLPYREIDGEGPEDVTWVRHRAKRSSISKPNARRLLEAIRKRTVEKQGIRGDSIRVQKQLLPELDCKRSTAGIAKSLKSSGCFPNSLLTDLIHTLCEWGLDRCA